MNTETGLIAGRPVRLEGRTLIPVVLRTVVCGRTGGVVSADPQGIYVIEPESEYYYRLAGDNTDDRPWESPEIAAVISDERTELKRHFV